MWEEDKERRRRCRPLTVDHVLSLLTTTTPLSREHQDRLVQPTPRHDAFERRSQRWTPSRSLPFVQHVLIHYPRSLNAPTGP
jgi:hypothetical protein